MAVARFVLFVIAYVIFFYFAQRAIRASSMTPYYVASAIGGFAPVLYIWLLVDKFDITFVLLTATFVLYGLLLRAFQYLRFKPAGWADWAAMRMGAEVSSGRLMIVFTVSILSALLAIAYPVVLGILYFSDRPNAHQLIVLVIFVQIVVMFLLFSTATVVLINRGVPARYRNMLHATSVVSILISGAFVGYFLFSFLRQTGADLQLSAAQAAIAISGVFLVTVLYSVVPYLVGWSRGKRLMLNLLEERLQVIDVAQDRLKPDFSPQHAQAMIDELTELADGEGDRSVAPITVLAWQLTEIIREDMGLSRYRFNKVKEHIRTTTAEIAATSDDREFANLMTELGRDPQQLQALTATVMTMLTGQERFPEDEQRKWLQAKAEELSSKLEIASAIEAEGVRRSFVYEEFRRLGDERQKIVTEIEKLSSRHVPGLAILTSALLFVFSAFFKEIGSWFIENAPSLLRL